MSQQGPTIGRARPWGAGQDGVRRAQGETGSPGVGAIRTVAGSGARFVNPNSKGRHRFLHGLRQSKSLFASRDGPRPRARGDATESERPSAFPPEGAEWPLSSAGVQATNGRRRSRATIGCDCHFPAAEPLLRTSAGTRCPFCAGFCVALAAVRPPLLSA